MRVSGRSGPDDKAVRLRDTFTRRLVGEPLTGHKDWVQGLAFSPDGTLITTGGNDGVRLWDTATRWPIGEPLTGSRRALLLDRYHNEGRLQYAGHHDPDPGGRHCGRRPARYETTRASVDRLVVLRRVGQPGEAERHVGRTRAGAGSRRGRRPGRLRPVAAPRTLAPRPT
ncbi:hypothetical protein [Streptomyces sp. NPDC047453]|uniref:WD40 repeat domain-containing protein n=1 Tax=Streptomyces sp. NPDC047453 TaxID=3154812 RepID=UPI003407A497